jgi:hypothetical protein
MSKIHRTICVGLVGSLLLTKIAAAQPPQWVPLANTLYILAPAEGSKTFLGASIDTRTQDVAINIFDTSHDVCKMGDDMPVADATPINIDGRFVKFKSACINGMYIRQPATAAGKQFLNAEVASGRPVTLDSGEGSALHYPGTSLKEVRAKLIGARDAM